MFKVSDIRDLAIQIERNGEAAYLRAAEKSTNDRIARLLKQLAEQEKEHRRWFEQLDVGDDISLKDDQIKRVGEDLLREMLEGQTFSLDEDHLADAAELKAVIEQSIEFENDTILFYEMLYGFLDDSATMAQLERIIHQERSHIDLLNDIAEKLISES